MRFFYCGACGFLGAYKNNPDQITDQVKELYCPVCFYNNAYNVKIYEINKNEFIKKAEISIDDFKSEIDARTRSAGLGDWKF